MNNHTHQLANEAPGATARRQPSSYTAGRGPCRVSGGAIRHKRPLCKDQRHTYRANAVQSMTVWQIHTPRLRQKQAGRQTDRHPCDRPCVSGSDHMVCAPPSFHSLRGVPPKVKEKCGAPWHCFPSPQPQSAHTQASKWKNSELPSHSTTAQPVMPMHAKGWSAKLQVTATVGLKTR